MRLLPLILRIALGLLLPLTLFAAAPARWPEPGPRQPPVFERLLSAACGSASLQRVAAAGGQAPCVGAGAEASAPLRSAVGALRPFAAVAAANGDGTLLGRQRLVTLGPVALDFVAYLSSGLAVGGLLCFVDDGQPRSTVIHLHGGFGGLFVNPDGGDTVGTCYRWAAQSGRTAFVPSFRGQDGGQGQPELCLGEADDVAAAAIFLRGLDVVDPDRLALVGGSMGGCVALRAGTKIPNLRAVVAIAPMTDWKSLVTFHRTAWAPKVETRCDGSTLDWNTGGPAFADVIDGVVCGHAGCTDAEYAARSPIPDVLNATNPTLVLAAGDDNIVPVQQQVLWSALRNVFGGSVAVDIRDRCSAVAAPPLGQDVLLYVPGAYHLMEDGPVISGLVYLSDLLDAAGAGPGAGL
jgi:dienelactone hydrolase